MQLSLAGLSAARLLLRMSPVIENTPKILKFIYDVSFYLDGLLH